VHEIVDLCVSHSVDLVAVSETWLQSLRPGCVIRIAQLIMSAVVPG
jgi:hypothetical protein